MNKTKWDANNIQDQKGRIAIVNGSSSGIGFETARVLANIKTDCCPSCWSRGSSPGNSWIWLSDGVITSASMSMPEAAFSETMENQ